MYKMICVRCNDRYEAESSIYCLCPECFEYLHRCLGTTAKGEQCKNYHSNVSGYCSKHKKGHEQECTHAITYKLMEAFMLGYYSARERYYSLPELETYPVDNWLRVLVEKGSHD